MTNSENPLKDLASKTKDKKDASLTTVIENANANANDASTLEEDDAAIVIGQIPTSKKTSEIKNSQKIEADASASKLNASTDITDDDLRIVMPDLTVEEFAKNAKSMKRNLSAYRKNLIINNGFTPEEADEAAKNKMKKDGAEVNNEYLEDNPNLAVVEIDKKNQNKVTFSTEEKEKLTRAKAIKLVVVENKDLESIKINKIDKKQKSTFLKTIEGGLSKYSVPLPILGDYVTFKGAQIVQLIATTKYEDDHIEDLVNKKAALIYDRMVGGTIYNKYGDSNKVEMTYNDFANSFKFHDINLAMYAILVASSMEETESTLSCPACNNPFQWKYNIKSLLKLDSMNDHFKELTDTILGHKNDCKLLESLHEENYKVNRYKSPITKNIYDVSYPSIARVSNMFAAINSKDETQAYLSAIGIFLQSMYVYNVETDDYVEIDADEITTMMEVLQTLPQADIDILFNEIKDKLYEPEFVMESKCPNCGEKLVNKLSIDELIFLNAQDTAMEIR